MTTTADDVADLSEADVAALQLALDLTLADDPPDPGRVEQVQSMLEDRSWCEVSKFCAYHQQMARLNAFPWSNVPCWILDDTEANAILAKGPILSATGNREDIGDRKYARLLKRMLRWGVSPYHPDPITAVKEAQRAKRTAAKVVRLRGV